MAQSLQGTGAATTEELEELIGNVYDLGKCLPRACSLLNLSMVQLGIFCRNTPQNKKGQALWDEFVTRQSAKPKGTYGFSHFMKEVLAEAGHPID